MFAIHLDEQIQLVLLEKCHAARIFELTDEGRPYLREWLPWVDWTTQMSDTEKYIEVGLQRFAQGNGFEAGIVYNGEIVGVTGLHYINNLHKITSIGYWLGEGYQGKGIMTRAVKGLTSYCFNELGLNRVEIRVVPENDKSRAIPERLNFTKEGVLRHNECLNGEFRDHIVFSMLKHEWPNS